MTTEATYSAYLEAVRADLQLAARRQAQAHRRRRTQLRAAGLSLAVLVLLAGTAVAGQSILGARTSSLVQSTIDSLWKGGDRSELAPLRGNARAVAHVGGTVLYRSASTDPGSVCVAIVSSELAVSGDEGEQRCIERLSTPSWPRGVSWHPFGGRFAFFGQVRLPSGGALVLELPGGGRSRVTLGLDGWFLGLLPLARGAPGAPPPLEGTLRILDRNDRVVSSRTLLGLTG